VQRWPETKRLLGLLVNSSGAAHGRNARRLVHASRKHDRRLAAALLAAALGHTPEAEEVLRGARNRMARKPSALARELVRNFPKGGKRKRKNRSSRSEKAAQNGKVRGVQANEVLEAIDSPETGELIDPAELADAGMSVVDSPDED
jgi:ribonuclease E